MSSIDTTIPLLAVLLITVAGVAALPWTHREVAESARAFRTLAGLARAALVRIAGSVQRGAVALSS